eukprot:TRINITY_DN11526_c0_g1_i5.p1 TRINITY_DN11526_c0_g1~~TRINITY_DN11526_c0_g1_i5.p1  ORF type:complete len:716 (+),score=47.60 TRINITY_DN11526_c0_g1_i5:99-2246(+)
MTDSSSCCCSYVVVADSDDHRSLRADSGNEDPSSNAAVTANEGAFDKLKQWLEDYQIISFLGLSFACVLPLADLLTDMTIALPGYYHAGLLESFMVQIGAIASGSVLGYISLSTTLGIWGTTSRLPLWARLQLMAGGVFTFPITPVFLIAAAVAFFIYFHHLDVEAENKNVFQAVGMIAVVASLGMWLSLLVLRCNTLHASDEQVQETLSTLIALQESGPVLRDDKGLKEFLESPHPLVTKLYTPTVRNAMPKVKRNRYLWTDRDECMTDRLDKHGWEGYSYIGSIGDPLTALLMPRTIARSRVCLDLGNDMTGDCAQLLLQCLPTCIIESASLSLAMSSKVSNETIKDLQLLPFTVHGLSLYFHHRPEANKVTDDAFKHLPDNLKDLALVLVGSEITDKALKELPEGLTTFSLYANKHITDDGLKSLPKSLTEFSLSMAWQGSITGDFLAFLPESVTELTISMSELGPKDITDVPFKNISPHVLRLTLQLDSNTGITGDLFGLLPATITHLDLNLNSNENITSEAFRLLPRGLKGFSVSLNSNKTISDEAFSYLPAGLQELSIDLDSNKHITSEAMKHLPKDLTHLTVSADKDSKLSNDAFDTLPNSLKRVRLYLQDTESITDQAFKCLPSGIETLRLSVSGPSISDAAFKDLPADLTFLSLSLGSKNESRITDGALKCLPPKLTTLVLYDGEDVLSEDSVKALSTKVKVVRTG